jgi:BirA family biotin operon repressor/biotin-[acetyl-CoA-carboxylase] ligase
MSPGSPTWDLDHERLAGTRFATVRFYDQLGSTNSELVEDARVGAPEGLVIVADHQTAGRGRLDRTWSAEPGTSLLVSVLLRPPLPISEVPVVLMAAGLAASDAVESAAGFRPQLKWPNDLVAGDRKLAGLLTESAPGEVTAVILGLGVNVTATAYPPELAETATSCDEQAQRPVDRTELLVAFLTALEARYSAVLVKGGRDTTMEAYRADSATIGRRVRVELPTGALEGTAARVAWNGQLIVVDDNGGQHVVNAGDVIHLRS